MQNQEKDRIFLKQCYSNSGANLCWALGGIICNFTPILPYFQHWGDEPRPRLFSGEQIEWRPKKRSSPQMDHVFLRIQVKTKKKGFSPKMKHFFPEFKYRPALRCTPESNYWRGCRWRPYSNYWGDTVKLLGGYIPPSRQGFDTPVRKTYLALPIIALSTSQNLPLFCK